MQKKAESINCSEACEKYILSIVFATRSNDGIKLGISPRGSIALTRAAKAYAYIEGRDYVIPDDIDSLTDEIWSNLDEDNKISLYVRYIDLIGEEYEERLINKYE